VYIGTFSGPTTPIYPNYLVQLPLQFGPLSANVATASLSIAMTMNAQIQTGQGPLLTFNTRNITRRILL